MVCTPIHRVVFRGDRLRHGVPGDELNDPVDLIPASALRPFPDDRHRTLCVEGEYISRSAEESILAELIFDWIRLRKLDCWKNWVIDNVNKLRNGCYLIQLPPMSEEKPDNYPVESSDDEIPFVSEKLKEEFSITHDSFFKQTFGTKDIAQAFLRHVLPPEIVCQLNLDNLEIQNGSLTDSDYFKNSAADLIYVVPLKQGAQNLHVDVILEHKSQPDQFTIFQLTRYTVRILEKELKAAQESDKTLKYFRFPTVIPIIIHNGDTPFTSPCELKELFNVLPGAERYTLNLEAILFDLNQILF